MAITVHDSASDLRDSVDAPTSADGAAKALSNGPHGALLVSAIAVALLLIGWMAFYFLLFLPRGPIG